MNPVRPRERARIVIESADDLQPERKPVGAYAARHADAGHMQEGPHVAERRVTGGLQASGRLAGRRRREQYIAVAESVGHPLAIFTPQRNRAVIVLGLDLIGLGAAVAERRPEFFAVLEEFVGKRAADFPYRDMLLRLGQGLEPFRQRQVLHRRAGGAERLRGVLQRRLHLRRGLVP